MITIQELDNFLELLQYSEEKEGIFVRRFNEGTSNEFSVIVDKNSEQFIYPDYDGGMKIHRRTTTNFKENENFVVFEAVTRLFEIGYLPKHVELEFNINLGRGQGKVAGWADILIKTNSDQPFMVVEAKTAGKEFDTAWKKTLQDGYQLFSYVDYFKTKRKFPYGVLYSSNIVNGELHRNYHLISFSDNDEFLKQEKKSKRKLFKNASNAKEIFQVWKETYDCDFSPIGAFETDVEPFKVQEKRYTIDDIFNNPLDTEGLIHKFRTILRQHNVSGRENAFDRLLNLLLAKIVDEKQSSENGRPLDFYWRGLAFDDKKSLVDRLQRLYRDGMRDYLHEDVTYIDRHDVDNAFVLFKNDKDATRDLIQHYFEKLKFYTDNFFAFIDVYNEELFDKNFEVLSEIVKLFQNVSLTNTEQHQFLGDLFEKLLDQGIKQSEGQFFTPIPIVKFLVSSLPLEDMIKDGEIPKVIDYASGAGHFLTEYAGEIQSIVPNESLLPKYYESIFGIEKESRLAKVSKVSALMYGANETQIFFHDALSKFEAVQDNTFDVLIANPPYSVKGFLETLSKDERNQFELSKFVTNIETNSSIETFFVERANQLLRIGGVAAIILPSSILQKNEAVFIKTRKILLENFEIIAIFEAGTGTFGKTGTTTDTLFLRKKSNKPNLYDHFLNRTNNWYDEDFKKDDVFEDRELLEEFSQLLGLKVDEVLANIGYQERLIYFMIVSQQKSDVLIVKTPNDKKEAKKFLGYDWSNRKGSEGIVYLNNDKKLESIITSLYNPYDKKDPSKINNAISKNFLGELEELPVLPSDVKSNSLISLIDWKNQSFDLAININRISSQKPITLKEGERIVSLGDSSIFEMGIGKRIVNSELNADGEYPVYSANVNIPFGHIDKLLIDDFSKPSVIWGIDGDWQVGYIKQDIPFYPTDHIGYLRVKSEEILPRFIVSLIEAKGSELNFSRSNRASMAKMKNIQIVIPPIEEQKRVVAEYERIEQEQEKARQEINNLDNKISEILGRVRGELYSLNDLFAFSDMKVDVKELNLSNYVGVENLVKNIGGKVNAENLPDIQSVTSYKTGDILLSNIRPYLQKIWLADTEGGASNDVLVLTKRESSNLYSEFAYYRLADSKFFDYEMQATRGLKMPRGDKNHIMQYSIQIPTLEEQERVLNEIHIIESQKKTLENHIAKLEESSQKVQ